VPDAVAAAPKSLRKGKAVKADGATEHSSPDRSGKKRKAKGAGGKAGAKKGKGKRR